jgi:predicted DNA-binding transcriptional regulator YafY
VNRIDRLTAILIHLQGKKLVTAQELAGRFGISLRTVYRDIRALEEAGVPIGAEAGKGYFISEGYHLPPVMFTNDEAGALLLGGKLIEKMADASVKTTFDSALYKIRSVLKHKSQDYLNSLDERIAVTALPQAQHTTHPYLAEAQQAIASKSVLQISYRKMYGEAVSLRKIEPIGLYHYSQSWHLIAFCRLRRDYRDFRVDRIEKLMPTGELFDSRNLYSLNKYLERMMASTPMEKAVVKFGKRIARYIQTQKFTQGFAAEEELPDGIRMTFLIYDREIFARWLLSYTNAVEIESPEALKDHMRTLIQELQVHYSAVETP